MVPSVAFSKTPVLASSQQLQPLHRRRVAVASHFDRSQLRAQPAGSLLSPHKSILPVSHFNTHLTVEAQALVLDGGSGGFGGNNGGSSGGGGSGGERWWNEDSSDPNPGLTLSDLFATIIKAVASALAVLSAQFPTMSSGLMTACSMCLAECLVQLAVLRHPALETEPLLRAIAYGFCLKGPALSIFYGWLNKTIVCRKGWNLVKLLLLDCAVGNFLFSSMYVTAMPLLKGESLPAVCHSFKDNVFGIWAVGLKIWPIAMTLNYLFLPPALQVPYILAVDVMANVAMGMKSQSSEPSKVEDTVINMVERTEYIDAVSVPFEDAMAALEDRLEAAAAATATA